MDGREAGGKMMEERMADCMNRYMKEGRRKGRKETVYIKYLETSFWVPRYVFSF